MVVPWWAWGLLANACVALNEYVARAGTTSFLQSLWYMWPFYVLLQLGIFYGWRGAPSMMLAWAVFTVTNSAFRLVNVTWAVGEPPSATTLAGVALMVMGAYAIKLGSA